MSRELIIIALVQACMMMSVPSIACELPEVFQKRKEVWQHYLDVRQFGFAKDKPGLNSSLEHFSATCQLHIVVHPTPEKMQKYSTYFKWVRNGEEVLVTPGHTESVFRTFDDKLYMANFAMSPGCTVSAFDLSNGKTLWKTQDISGLRQGGASGYTNQVLMRLSRFNEVPDEIEGAVLIIMGHEEFGDYITVVDRETGLQLAHKIYSTGFGPSK